MSGLESETHDLLKNPAYTLPFDEIRESFLEIATRGWNKDLPTIGINGYTPEEEQMLKMTLAVAISPDLLRLSQCTHRAVSASVGLHFEEELPEKVIYKIMAVATVSGILSTIRIGDGGTYMVTHGVNNWLSEIDPNFPDKLRLDCKLIPGLPTEVPRDTLLHLNAEVKYDNLSLVDNACPKRTKGLKCRIAHAEKAALYTAINFSNMFKLPPAKKTVLTSTWVPCPDCVEYMTINEEVFGGSDIDIFSIYEARGDVDDQEMKRSINTMMKKRGLHDLSGPYIGLEKTEGYGWQPATHEFVSEVYRDLHKRILVDARILSLITQSMGILPQFNQG